MSDAYAALKVAPFRRFILFLGSSTLAMMMQGVAVGWQLYDVTRDPLALGLVGLAEALPFIGFALPAGQLADRVDRRRLCLGALIVLFLCSVSLFTLSAAHAISGSTAGLIYAVVFVSGIARSYLQPTRTALAADLVPRELYANSITWRSSTWQSSAVMGPAVGGVLVALGGPALAYGMTALLFAGAWAAMYRVSVMPHEPSPDHGEGLAGIMQGIRFALGQPVLLGAQLLDLFSVLFAGAEALLPIFAADILHVGAAGLGVLRAAPAAGSVMMSIYQAHWPPRWRMGRVLFVSVALYGLCITAFGLSRSFGLSVSLLFVSGVCDNVSVLIRSFLLQTLTPRHMLGRINSINAIFIGSSNEIGAFESGVAAKLLGTVPAVVLGGLVPMVVVALMAWRVPELRRLERIG